MLADEINVKRSILEFLIHWALVDTVEWTRARCMKRPQEPDYVAGLTVRFTKNLYYILKACLPQRVFSVTGVYCHQKPIAQMEDSKVSAEIGDLLLAFVDEDYLGRRIYNALLLQAKMTYAYMLRLKDGEKHQLELYSRWPKFIYKKTGILNGTKRDIFPKSISNGAQYLLIDELFEYDGFSNQINDFPMACALPNDTLQADNRFATEIISFLRFKSGRTFDDYFLANDDWSRMIWDLLKCASNAISKRRNISLDGFERLSNMSHLSDDGIKCILLNDEFGYQSSREYENEDGGGISVVLIETVFHKNKENMSL